MSQKTAGFPYMETKSIFCIFVDFHVWKLTSLVKGSEI